LDEAAVLMKRYLFDYSDLTDFERNVMKRVFPWYTWTRKNAALLMEIALTSPRKLALIPKIQLNVEHTLAGEDTLPPSLRPAHIAKEAGVQISGGTNPHFLNMGYMLPIGELRMNPLQPVQAAKFLAEQAGGPLRTAAELLTNRDLYFDRPITEYPGQRKELLGIPMPPAAKHVLRQVRPLNVIEQAQRSMAATGTPASAAEAGLAAATGIRTFPVDVARQVFEQERGINDQLGAVRRDLKRRLVELQQVGGDPNADGEANRLLAIHEELAQQRDNLPLPEVRGMRKDLSNRRRKMLDEYLAEARQ
jgi:hypothetical protein